MNGIVYMIFKTEFSKIVKYFESIYGDINLYAGI